jgi:hypothetical protein
VTGALTAGSPNRTWLQVAQRLQKKEVTNLAAHRAKTRKLAENYETRVDGWLVNTQQGKIDAVPRVRLACHHTFRERSRELELGHDRVSPQLYTSERERIGRELTHGSSSLVMRDRWAPKRGSLFREREPGKECQPAMVYRPRTSNDRINEEISKMPVMPLQPWTRFDHPSYRKFRPDDPTKHVGGRFQLDLTKGERTPKPEKNFLFSQIPFAAPFGARSDDFRPADVSMHIEGPFYNIVPGYSPDSLPGVWRMDAEISGPPISPTYWNEHAGRPRTSSPDPASDTVKSPSSRQSQAGTRLSSPNRSCYSRTLKVLRRLGLLSRATCHIPCQRRIGRPSRRCQQPTRCRLHSTNKRLVMKNLSTTMPNELSRRLEQCVNIWASLTSIGQLGGIRVGKRIHPSAGTR